MCITSLTIIFSTFNVCVQWKQDKPYTFQLSRISTALNFIFVLEVLMKLIAFTPRGYWQSRRNRYDLFVTILGANWICINYNLQVCALTIYKHYLLVV